MLAPSWRQDAAGHPLPVPGGTGPLLIAPRRPAWMTGLCCDAEARANNPAPIGVESPRGSTNFGCKSRVSWSPEGGNQNGRPSPNPQQKESHAEIQKETCGDRSRAIHAGRFRGNKPGGHVYGVPDTVGRGWASPDHSDLGGSASRQSRGLDHHRNQGRDLSLQARHIRRDLRSSRVAPSSGASSRPSTRRGEGSPRIEFRTGTPSPNGSGERFALSALGRAPCPGGGPQSPTDRRGSSPLGASRGPSINSGRAALGVQYADCNRRAPQEARE